MNHFWKGFEKSAKKKEEMSSFQEALPGLGTVGGMLAGTILGAKGGRRLFRNKSKKIQDLATAGGAGTGSVGGSLAGLTAGGVAQFATTTPEQRKNYTKKRKKMREWANKKK